jgi:CubicO group peptidase (beta-lactamase class C family)
MTRSIACWALIGLLFSCSSPPATEVQASPPDPLTARIDSFMQHCTRAGFNGSLLVMRDGAALIDTGYGLRDREKQLANTPATVHAIGSITKQFTAAAMLKLEEQGRLRVDDPMSKYVKNVPSDKAAITLHQLLTHSAGFPDAIGDDYAPIERDDFLELAMRTPLEFKPGMGYNYSNVGYSILGAIVELVSGKSYERYLHDELLEPAGLAHTGYQIPDWSKAELAIGYRKDGERWGTMLDHPWASDGPYWHLRCNGGLLSTTHDMYDWVQALHAHKVLGSAEVTKMFTPYVEEGEGSGSHYGYGWAIFKTRRGTKLITHNGGNGVQFADVLFFVDEGVTVVMMSNASARGMQDVAWEVGRMVFDPTYQPRLPQASRTLTSIPEGAFGDRLKALSAIIGSGGDDAQLTTWLQNNLGPGFLKDIPMERHVGMFKQLHTDIGEHSVETVEQVSPEEFALRLRGTRDQRLFRVLVQLRPSDAKISGLGVEVE